MKPQIFSPHRWSRSVWCSLAIGISVVVPLLAFTPRAARSEEILLAQVMQSLRQSGDRWIEIDLSNQRLYAWEGDTQVYAVIVSTGLDSSPTLPGTFAIQSMHREARMQGADYDVPDVPFTMYYDGNYAIHGTYWHSQFGTQMSHGCVNVAVDHAEWLFYWADIGVPVHVHY